MPLVEEALEAQATVASEGETSAQGLAMDCRALLELLADNLGMVKGEWRLEARYKDGTLLRIDRHQEKIPASALERRGR